MLTLLAYLLILWSVLALGCLVAWWVGRRRGTPQSGDFTDALMFVGFSFGFLLGLLQIFVTNHLLGRAVPGRVRGDDARGDV